MKKIGVIGAMASMLITNAFFGGGNVVTSATPIKPNKPNAKNKPSKARWRSS